MIIDEAGMRQLALWLLSSVVRLATASPSKGGHGGCVRWRIGYHKRDAFKLLVISYGGAAKLARI